MRTYVKSDKPLAVVDTEVYRNYFLLKVRRLSDGKTVSLEQYDGLKFDGARARQIMSFHETVSFNGRNFDLPIIALAAIKGLSCEDLKEWCDRIIKGGMKPWEVEREAGFRVPTNWNHIDLIQVAPSEAALSGKGTVVTQDDQSRASLKIYGGRLHSKKMQDLPIEPNAIITPPQRAVLDHYCGNDLDTTADLLFKLTDQLELRRRMGVVYGGVDLMSKSDAQVAEAVIKKRLFDLTGSPPDKPIFRPGKTFKYDPPKALKLVSPEARRALDIIKSIDFRVGPKGNVETPPELDTEIEPLDVRIGKGVYRMGLGGLHSSEKSTTHLADSTTLLIDRDVASYYPRIILNNNYFPEHLGQDFLAVFDAVVVERLAAKERGDKVTADSLKITINGTFGKLGSRFSIFYSPNLLIHVTLSGQFFLLMLIERIEAAGIPVVSANTDGIVIKCPKARYADLNAIVAQWEKETGFETEETRYKALASRDVNNYMAVKLAYDKATKTWLDKADGVKGKGSFAPPGLQKNPTTVICVEAVSRYLLDKTPIEATIRSCNDVRKFVAIRQVRGGGIYAGRRVDKPDPSGKGKMRGRAVIDKWWEPKMIFSHVEGGVYLGKAVRFYYSTESEGQILGKVKGGAVPKTEGCKPMMELTSGVPGDLDYDWYIREANDILEDLGLPRDKSRWFDHLI